MYLCTGLGVSVRGQPHLNLLAAQPHPHITASHTRSFTAHGSRHHRVASAAHSPTDPGCRSRQSRVLRSAVRQTQQSVGRSSYVSSRTTIDFNAVTVPGAAQGSKLQGSSSAARPGTQTAVLCGARALPRVSTTIEHTGLWRTAYTDDRATRARAREKESRPMRLADLGSWRVQGSHDTTPPPSPPPHTLAAVAHTHQAASAAASSCGAQEQVGD